MVFLNMLTEKLKDYAEKAAVVKQRFPLRGAQKWVWAICRFVLMAGLSFVILYPLLYMASMALRPLNQILDPSIVWIPKSLTLDNFIKAAEYMGITKLNESNEIAFNTDLLKNPLIMTALITIGCTLLQMISAALAGYGLARFKFRGRSVLFALLILSIIVPPQTFIIPLFKQYQTFGILETYFAMGLPALFANGIRSGLVIYIFMQFFKGLPAELEDAAYVDGCGSFKTFLRIIMPNSLPVLVTVFIFSIVWYWTDYFYSSMFFTGTLSVALKTVEGKIRDALSTYNPYEIQSVIQAGCLLLVLPLLIVYLFLQRLFVQSIERTGITG